MQDLSIIELFSGTGMQRRGLENAGCFNIIPICTSEINEDAIISYAACHCNLTQNLIDTYNYPSTETMIKELTDKNIGYDALHNKRKTWKTDKVSLAKLKKVYLADKLQNNIGDISKYKKELPQADLWFYSFPCTDISNAGSMKGIQKSTRSGLLYEVERLLELNKNHLPKFLCLENVDDLVNKKFKPNFDNWLLYLENLGYSNYWKIMDSSEYGVPQTRKRVFCVSIKKNIHITDDIFPKKFDNGLTLKDYLDAIDTIPNNFFMHSYKKEAHTWIPKWLYEQQKETVIRKLTPKEAYKIMGMSDSDIKSVLYLNLSQTAMFKIAGNGIVTECVKLIGQHLYKAIYDNTFICDDEKYEDLQNSKTPICLNKSIKNTTFKTHTHQPSSQDRVYDSNGVAVALTTGFLPWYIQRKD